MQIEVITKQDLQELKSEILSEMSTLLSGKGEQKEWLKSADVMKMLGISAGTLQTLRITKVLPFTKVGGTIYYPQSDVINVLEKNKNDVK